MQNYYKQFNDSKEKEIKDFIKNADKMTTSLWAQAYAIHNRLNQ